MLGVSSIDPKAKVESLSVGQSQLVEIAKALANQPKILILDEPTASLSSMEIEQLFHSINILKQQQISIIYITHYLEDILKICDRVTVLRDGIKVSTTQTRETSIKGIVDSMLGDQEDLHQRDWQNQTITHTNKPILLELKNVSSQHVSRLNLSSMQEKL